MYTNTNQISSKGARLFWLCSLCYLLVCISVGTIIITHHQAEQNIASIKEGTSEFGSDQSEEGNQEEREKKEEHTLFSNMFAYQTGINPVSTEGSLVIFPREIAILTSPPPEFS